MNLGNIVTQLQQERGRIDAAVAALSGTPRSRKSTGLSRHSLRNTSRNKQTLVLKFDQLAELRNAIRHSRAVDDIKRKEGEAAILWFEQVLKLAAHAS